MVCVPITVALAFRIVLDILRNVFPCVYECRPFPSQNYGGFIASESVGYIYLFSASLNSSLDCLWLLFSPESASVFTY